MNQNDMPKQIVLAVYALNDEFIGYKADTFWTLVQKKEDAKTHSVGNTDHLFKNFIYVLNKMDPPKEGDLVGSLIALTKANTPYKKIQVSDTLYVKFYPADLENGNPIETITLKRVDGKWERVNETS